PRDGSAQGEHRHFLTRARTRLTSSSIGHALQYVGRSSAPQAQHVSRNISASSASENAASALLARLSRAAARLGLSPCFSGSSGGRLLGGGDACSAPRPRSTMRSISGTESWRLAARVAI